MEDAAVLKRSDGGGGAYFFAAQLIYRATLDRITFTRKLATFHVEILFLFIDIVQILRPNIWLGRLPNRTNRSDHFLTAHISIRMPTRISLSLASADSFASLSPFFLSLFLYFRPIRYRVSRFYLDIGGAVVRSVTMAASQGDRSRRLSPYQFYK